MRIFKYALFVMLAAAVSAFIIYLITSSDQAQQVLLPVQPTKDESRVVVVEADTSDEIESSQSGKIEQDPNSEEDQIFFDELKDEDITQDVGQDFQIEDLDLNFDEDLNFVGSGTIF